MSWRVWSRSALQHKFNFTCSSKNLTKPLFLPLWSMQLLYCSPGLWDFGGGLITVDTGSFYINSMCCGINGNVTLPAAWAPCSTAFNGMPVIAARWPTASNAASRHWLLFLCASVTIDVISDSQPWGKKKRNPSEPTSLIKINLPVNQCQRPRKTTSVGWRDCK